MNHGMRNPSWQLEYENNVSVSSQQTSMLVPDGASDTSDKNKQNGFISQPLTGYLQLINCSSACLIFILIELFK